jgi:large subunit ribosomal protein L16
MFRVPNHMKFRKVRKGKVKNIETKTVNLDFGSYGLQVTESARLSAAQLEAVRRVLSRKMKRSGSIWFRVYPDRPISEKPAEVRMGKGKGSVGYWACYVAAGRMLLEIDGVSKDMAISALTSGKMKLPCGARIVERPTFV